jgi:hypothetical protein
MAAENIAVRLFHFSLKHLIENINISLIFGTLSFPLSVFSLSFFLVASSNFFLCISWLAPTDEAAEMVL